MILIYFLLLCFTIGVGVCRIFYRFSVVYNLIVSFSRLITLVGGELRFFAIGHSCLCMFGGVFTFSGC